MVHHPWGPAASSSAWPSSSGYGGVQNGYSYSASWLWHDTFRTSTSTGSSPTMASDHRSRPPAPTETPLQDPAFQPHSGLTTGALAAAIVIPILTLFSAVALIFLCLRRRAQNSRDSTAPIVAGGGGIKGKLGSFRRRRDLPPANTASEPPILMSEHNNAYYTGLDTSASDSRPNSEYHIRGSYEPPPPYIRETSPPPTDGRARSPFEDPPDHPRYTEDTYLAVAGRPGLRRSASDVSVPSTLYSDHASVHRAREARRSVGGAQVVETTSSISRDGYRRGSDPFVSPVDSPTSLTGGGGDGSRRVSDVSEADRR